VNPAPDLAGLQFCLDELIAMRLGMAEDQSRWRKFRSEIPEVPTQMIERRKAIAPAATWANKRNNENGELYPVFPFRCFGLGSDTADVVAWTMAHRTCEDSYGSACWTQDQIDWAYAGRAVEAAEGLVRRFRIASTQCRFCQRADQNQPLVGTSKPASLRREIHNSFRVCFKGCLATS